MSTDSRSRGRMFAADEWIIRSVMVMMGMLMTLALVQTPRLMAQETLEISAFQTVDTTEKGDASFQRSGNRFSITARGGFYKDGEAYGAVYVPDIFRSRMRAEVTIEHQERVREWTKTGLKLASDMSKAGKSPGDVILVATPDHGVSLAVDKDRDGDVENIANSGGKMSFPLKLKIERSGAFVTGYYRSDGGETYVKVGTAQLDDPDEAMDVGMAQVSSKPNNPGKAVFSGFQIINNAAINPVTKPDPLPQDAEPLDRIIFGNRPSEKRHGFAPESSWLTRGQYGIVCRQLQRVIPEVDVPYEWIIGSMAFKMKVDPDERNFLTVQLQQDHAPFDPAPMAIFYGDKQIGYMNGREGYSTPGNLYGENVITGDWVYVTSVLQNR